MTSTWNLEDRDRALSNAAREGLDLLVIGGGITGAGVLRDAASRGLRTLLVERTDFAAGTSSRSSKMVHGGIRYIGEGQLRMTREACRERDLLQRQNPQLVRPQPFLFPAWQGGKLPLWQVRASLWIYSALANFRRSARTRMLSRAEIERFAPGLRLSGLLGAGLYTDAQVDDVRLVLETVKSARRLGGEAVNHAEVVEFLREGSGRLTGARVRDLLGGRTHELRAHVVVNAAGPSVERVRGLDRPIARPELRPAKGIHLVVPRDRVSLQGAVVLEAADGRHCFMTPWEDVTLIGTTDSFSDEIDEPVVQIDEVHYLLSAVNEAFPRAALTTNDLQAVFAGVRPLTASADADSPPSSVSREDRVYEDPSGLVSVAGGKLTTYRAMGERIVDCALRQLPPARRALVGASRTAELALREDDFDALALRAELITRFGVDERRAAYLIRSYGSDAATLLAEAPASLHQPIGSSRFVYAEIPWSFRTECPGSLCDLLERRMRMVLFAEGQGLRQLDRIVSVAAECAGWGDERAASEAAQFSAAVRCRYQIAGTTPEPVAERGVRAA